ncbi:hypothetical protein CDAR_441431 [Caerostris darwini]|uniref:Secreted protein n=1 Tax=Caerostris darwini TaxID=1538125 RepID=A0AAV4TR10_9ARAC|nr:hypothetical protein CDAR_441431 [Caerostris darwini]
MPCIACLLCVCQAGCEVNDSSRFFFFSSFPLQLDAARQGSSSSCIFCCGRGKALRIVYTLRCGRFLIEVNNNNGGRKRRARDAFELNLGTGIRSRILVWNGWRSKSAPCRSRAGRVGSG